MPLNVLVLIQPAVFEFLLFFVQLIYVLSLLFFVFGFFLCLLAATISWRVFLLFLWTHEYISSFCTSEVRIKSYCSGFWVTKFSIILKDRVSLFWSVLHLLPEKWAGNIHSTNHWQRTQFFLSAIDLHSQYLKPSELEETALEIH